MTIPAGFAEITFRYLELPPTPNGASVTFGVALENPTLTTPSQVAQACWTQLSDTAIEARIADTAAIGSCHCKFGPDETGPQAEYVANILGAAAGTASPPNISVLVGKQTTLGGRRGRGRMYWPGLIDTHVDAGGNLASGVQSAWQTVMNDFLGRLGTNDTPMVLLHGPEMEWYLTPEGRPKTRPVPGSTAPAPSVVTGLVVATLAATQRRRLRS